MAFCLQWQYLGDEERNNTCDNQNGNKSFYCCFYITTNVIRGDGSRKLNFSAAKAKQNQALLPKPTGTINKKMKHHTPRDYKLLFIFSCTHTIRNANLLTLSPDYLVAVHCCIITVRQSRCDVVTTLSNNTHY